MPDNHIDPASAARRLLEHIDSDPTAPTFIPIYERLHHAAPEVQSDRPLGRGARA